MLTGFPVKRIYVSMSALKERERERQEKAEARCSRQEEAAIEDAPAPDPVKASLELGKKLMMEAEEILKMGAGTSQAGTEEEAKVKIEDDIKVEEGPKAEEDPETKEDSRMEDSKAEDALRIEEAREPVAEDKAKKTTASGTSQRSSSSGSPICGKFHSFTSEEISRLTNVSKARVEELLGKRVSGYSLYKKTIRDDEAGGRRREEELEKTRFKYTVLNEDQKRELREHCWRGYAGEPKKTFWSWLGCYKIRPVPRARKIINPQVFGIIAYLRAHATRTRWIFRLEGEKEDGKRMALDLAEGRRAAYEEMDAITIGYALKTYIRQHLDGMIPVEVVDKLRDCIKRKDRLMKKTLLLNLPFIFYDDERSLLLGLFDLFRAIDENKDVTLMSLDSQLGLFSLVLFPQAAFVAIPDIDLVQLLMRELFVQDFMELPPSVIRCEVRYVP
jgi:hypothetical protein